MTMDRLDADILFVSECSTTLAMNRTRYLKYKTGHRSQFKTFQLRSEVTVELQCSLTKVKGHSSSAVQANSNKIEMEDEIAIYILFQNLYSNQIYFTEQTTFS